MAFPEAGCCVGTAGTWAVAIWVGTAVGCATTRLGTIVGIGLGSAVAVRAGLTVGGIVAFAGCVAIRVGLAAAVAAGGCVGWAVGSAAMLTGVDTAVLGTMPATGVLQPEKSNAVTSSISCCMKYDFLCMAWFKHGLFRLMVY